MLLADLVQVGGHLAWRADSRVPHASFPSHSSVLAGVWWQRITSAVSGKETAMPVESRSAGTPSLGAASLRKERLGKEGKKEGEKFSHLLQAPSGISPAVPTLGTVGHGECVEQSESPARVCICLFVVFAGVAPSPVNNLNASDGRRGGSR